MVTVRARSNSMAQEVVSSVNAFAGIAAGALTLATVAVTSQAPSPLRSGKPAPAPVTASAPTPLGTTDIDSVPQPQATRASSPVASATAQAPAGSEPAPTAPTTIPTPPIASAAMTAAAGLTKVSTPADTGSAVGPISTFQPTGDVTVAVGQLTQALIDHSPATTTFVIASGVHRLTHALTAKAGQRFLGQPGAVIDGSSVLTGWTASGSAWRVGNQSQRLPRAGDGSPSSNCASATPLCNDSEEVFRDGQRLTPVASAALLKPGTFFFDYSESSISVGDNPAGHLLETSVAPAAFQNASNNTFENLTIQKFASPAQAGAINGENLMVDHDTIQLNHGRGITQYGGVLSYSRILDNGQLGIGGGGGNLEVAFDEIGRNNADGYDPGWEAGGTKWAFSTDLTVENCWSHDNNGNGLWTDINNTRTTYRHNVVENNSGNGIMHEISFQATIVNNIVRDNGSAPGYYMQRSGIVITDSSNVEVVNNLVTDNVGGGVVAVQDTRSSGNDSAPWIVSGLSVHGNAIRQSVASDGAMIAGVWPEGGVADPDSYLTSKGNTFGGNAYLVPRSMIKGSLFQTAVKGSATSMTWNAWLASGQDKGSTFLTS